VTKLFDSHRQPGLRNLRDVGGVSAAAGRRVPLGRLYRSDAPIAGDPVPDLQPWPPRTVVDLRSPGEADAAAHPLAAAATRVVTIPLFRQLDPAELARRRGRAPSDLPTIYRGLLRTSALNLVSVMRVIAESPGPLLLHCAAGKDRTGVATAVALAAVGVPREAIVADYARTEESIDGLLQRLAIGWGPERSAARIEQLTVERPDLMRAPPAAIEAVLETLEAWPGGAPGWLLEHGLGEDRLVRLTEALTVSAPVPDVDAPR
jgi:hypothetical protein